MGRNKDRYALYVVRTETRNIILSIRTKRPKKLGFDWIRIHALYFSQIRISVSDLDFFLHAGANDI